MRMAGTAAIETKYTVVFIRHGESEWIQKNIYCGWYDSDLSRSGEREAEKAGQILRDAGFVFDEAHTSVLRRAIKTVNVILDVMKLNDISVHKTWRLNARHYGALTGLSKGESVRKYGEDQIKLWRRSYDIPPPEITKDNPYFDRIIDDPVYENGPSRAEFPLYESLKQAIERSLPYWKETIEPKIQSGKNILVTGHMNSLRAIIKHLDRISDEKIMEYNIPTGVPFIYELDTDMKPIVSLKFLGDDEYVKKANEILASSGKGFERPKRSKPSILEVYDNKFRKEAVDMKPELLATVESVHDNQDVKIALLEELNVETKASTGSIAKAAGIQESMKSAKEDEPKDIATSVKSGIPKYSLKSEKEDEPKDIEKFVKSAAPRDSLKSEKEDEPKDIAMSVKSGTPKDILKSEKVEIQKRSIKLVKDEEIPDIIKSGKDEESTKPEKDEESIKSEEDEKIPIDSIKSVKDELPRQGAKSVKGALPKDIKKTVQMEEDDQIDELLAKESVDSQDIAVDDKKSLVTSKLTPSQAAALIKESELKATKTETKAKKDKVEIDKKTAADDL